MNIIPVIDILDGQVVHAIRGQRERYKAVKSDLCNSSEPVAIVQAFLELHPFDKIYAADLNAITNRGNNTPIINHLKNTFPGIRFWVDNGASCQQDIEQPVLDDTIIVLGSETNISPKLLKSLYKKHPDLALSLDFRDGLFLGDSALWETPEVWPDKIILMNLDRVGSGSGIQKELLDSVIRKKNPKELYIAGGIQSMEDLTTLKHRGIDGVLMATALHSGKLKSEQIKDLLNT